MAEAHRLALDRDSFLNEYWQQKPLFIPNAVPSFDPPVSADELAGLAMESDVDSRIVHHADGVYKIEHGPFSMEALQCPGVWTLLVQSVDHYFASVAALRSLVDFIPDWRIDDIMVSYGNDGASVGPHYDNYDVFLLQGAGEKYWRLGQRCDSDTPLTNTAGHLTLENFEQQAQYHLRCGDVLYVPPGIAHWGIAKGESTTFSVGFRAPRLNDLLSRWTDAVLAVLPADRLLRDAGRNIAANSGEISQPDIERAIEQILRALHESDVGPDWFGELVTELPEAGAEAAVAGVTQPDYHSDGEQTTLARRPEARIAWAARGSSITVYANGHHAEFSDAVKNTVRSLCQNQVINTADAVVDASGERETQRLFKFLSEAGAIDVEG